MEGLKHVVNWNKPASKLANEPVEEPIWKAIRENVFGDQLAQTQLAQEGARHLCGRGRVRNVFR